MFPQWTRRQFVRSLPSHLRDKPDSSVGLRLKEELGLCPDMPLSYASVAIVKYCIISTRQEMSFTLFVSPGAQTEGCTRCHWTVTLSVWPSRDWGCTPSSGVQFLQVTVQSTSIGVPPLTDQTVNSSVADARIFTDAYRLGPAVEVLAQAPLLHVQSGHSKVLHHGSSCAAMGPHT